MGEAKRRDDAEKSAQLAGLRAAQNARATPMHLSHVAVCLQLDMARHVLEGLAHQLHNILDAPEPAAVLVKACEHIRAYRMRYAADVQNRVVLAQPGEVPPAPRVQL